jgi:hypothetical protein
MLSHQANGKGVPAAPYEGRCGVGKEGSGTCAGGAGAGSRSRAKPAQNSAARSDGRFCLPGVIALTHPQIVEKTLKKSLLLRDTRGRPERGKETPGTLPGDKLGEVGGLESPLGWGLLTTLH